MTIWLNDELVDGTRIDPRDRGLLLGDGLFETAAARGGRLLFWPAHAARLAAGAATLKIPLRLTPEELARACAAVLEASGLREAPRAAVRLTLTRGPGPRGLTPPSDPSPTLMISASAAEPPPACMSAALASPRRNALSPTARLKSLGCLDAILAREEARARGADEALLLDTAGRLSCAGAANVFLWENDRLSTPSQDCGILPGVTRAAVLSLAARLGVEAREDHISPERLGRADGAFLTNSLIGVMPLSRIDDRPLPPHPLTHKIQAAYERSDYARDVRIPRTPPHINGWQ